MTENHKPALALKLLLLTFVCTTELRAAVWREIDLDAAEWRIPAERMKMRDPHIVPLSEQAVSVFRELKQHKGNSDFIFKNEHSPLSCVSENTMIYALSAWGITRNDGPRFPLHSKHDFE